MSITTGGLEEVRDGGFVTDTRNEIQTFSHGDRDHTSEGERRNIGLVAVNDWEAEAAGNENQPPRRNNSHTRGLAADRQKMELKTHLELDYEGFAHRLKIPYEYARGESGWATGIVVDLDDAKRIISARNTARAAGNHRLNAKRARDGGGRK